MNKKVTKPIAEKTAQKSTIEDPYKKCMNFLSFLECQCQLPTYLFQFMELICISLEREADPQLSFNLLPKNKLGNEFIKRTLPIKISELPNGTIATKKKTQKDKNYKQIDKTERTSKLLYISDIKVFKQYVKKVATVVLGEKYPQYQAHSQYGDQDFRYLPLMWSIIYQIPFIKISDEDKDYISSFYVYYVEHFINCYKATGQCKNTKKLFLVIQQIIQSNEILFSKYQGLDKFITPESPNIQQQNKEIFETALSYISTNYPNIIEWGQRLQRN